jgi:hypothetical protein
MVQRRTVPCTLAAALTAADLPVKAGARMAELLVHGTGVPEPPLRRRLPVRPISPDVPISQLNHTWRLWGR